MNPACTLIMFIQQLKCPRSSYRNFSHMKTKHQRRSKKKTHKKNIISPSHGHKHSCLIMERAATLVSTHPHRHGRGTQKSFLSKRLHCPAAETGEDQARRACCAHDCCLHGCIPTTPALDIPFPLGAPQRSRLLVSRHCWPLLLLNGPKSTREPSIL